MGGYLVGMKGVLAGEGGEEGVGGGRCHGYIHTYTCIYIDTLNHRTKKIIAKVELLG